MGNGRLSVKNNIQGKLKGLRVVWKLEAACYKNSLETDKENASVVLYIFNCLCKATRLGGFLDSWIPMSHGEEG